MNLPDLPAGWSWMPRLDMMEALRSDDLLDQLLMPHRDHGCICARSNNMVIILPTATNAGSPKAGTLHPPHILRFELGKMGLLTTHEEPLSETTSMDKRERLLLMGTAEEVSRWRE